MNLLNVLTPAQLAVLQAVEDASHVTRPERPELKVGDTVIASGSGVRGRTTTVTKIGPKWITIGQGTATSRFDRQTWRGGHGYGIGASIRTPEQVAYDQRIATARSRLTNAGLRIPYLADVSDGRLLAVAALLELLDEEV